MAAASSIEWTDTTWNPVVGCKMVSSGCAHCYAATMAKRLRAMALADIAAGKDPGRKRHYIDAVDGHGRWTGKLIPVPEALTDPLGWKKPRRVFVNSMSDLFHEDVPDKFIDGVFAGMALAPQHTFQVLTKRAARLPAYFDGLNKRRRGYIHEHRGYLFEVLSQALEKEPSEHWEAMARFHHGDTLPKSVGDATAWPWPLRNVWLGVSVEDRRHGLPRIADLQAAPAAVRFLSVEPLLEDLGTLPLEGIHWVIVGGESGADARPMHPDWARSLRDQCHAAGVAFFFKQWGEWAPLERHHVKVPTSNYAFTPAGEKVTEHDGREIPVWPCTQIRNEDSFSAVRVGKKAAGRLLDGRTWDEFPEVPA